MDEQHLELARQAVALLRASLTGEDLHRNGAALARTTHSLAVYLLIHWVDPEDLENELDRIDGFLADRLADKLLDGIDWDALSGCG
jgi:hypothetical protein